MKVKADDVRAQSEILRAAPGAVWRVRELDFEFLCASVAELEGERSDQKVCWRLCEAKRVGMLEEVLPQHREKCLGLLGWCAAHTCLVLMPVFPLNCVALSTLIDELYVWFCVVQDHSWQLDRIFLRHVW